MISKIKGDILWNSIVHWLVLSTYCHPFMLRKHRGGSREGMQEVYTPTPWDDLRFSKISNILWKTTTNKQTKQNKKIRPGWSHFCCTPSRSPSDGPSIAINFLGQPFPSRFTNITIFFCNALEYAFCLLFDVRQYYCNFSIFIALSSISAVLFIYPFKNLLVKGLTRRACIGDAPSDGLMPLQHLI